MVFGGDGGPYHERGMRWGFFDWNFPGIEVAITVDGTLDERRDIDRAGRWKSLAPGRAYHVYWRAHCPRRQAPNCP